MYTFSEGSITIEVPEYEIQTSRNEVFYNPVMEFNRDTSVLLARCLPPGQKILCGMAGSGVRALRYEKDIPVMNKDINLIDGKYDVVDVDPFGSPVRYLHSIMRLFKKNGYLFVTATDTAALCGSFKNACIRKHGASPGTCACAHACNGPCKTTGAARHHSSRMLRISRYSL